MRFMVIVPANKDTEADILPTAEELAAMGKFSEEMVKAGVMLSGEGLRSTSKGARIRFTDKKPVVIDGPFTESKELVAGFWIMQTKSKEGAIAWMERAPFGPGTTLEIRQIFESEDFAPVDPTGELRKQDDELRKQAAR